MDHGLLLTRLALCRFPLISRAVPGAQLGLRDEPGADRCQRRRKEQPQEARPSPQSMPSPESGSDPLYLSPQWMRSRLEMSFPRELSHAWYTAGPQRDTAEMNPD